MPRRTNERAWRKLEASLTASRIASAHQEFVEKVQRRHELERRIRQLQERPKSPGRDRLIKELREELNR